MRGPFSLQVRMLEPDMFVELVPANPDKAGGEDNDPKGNPLGKVVVKEQDENLLRNTRPPPMVWPGVEVVQPKLAQPPHEHADKCYDCNPDTLLRHFLCSFLSDYISKASTLKTTIIITYFSLKIKPQTQKIHSLTKNLHLYMIKMTIILARRIKWKTNLRSHWKISFP